MAIFRIEKTDNYTAMSNYHLRDKNLSLKAKGLLSFMLSLPEDWDYSIRGLSAVCKEEKSTIERVLKELKDNDYLKIKKLLPNETQTGRFEYEYIIYETPQKTRPQKQGIEKQGLENGTQINTNIINTKKINNKNNNKEKNLFEIIEENYCRLLSPYEIDEIKTWPDTKLTRYVIKESVLKGIRNIKYISRILEDYRLNNITTIEQAKDKEKRRKNIDSNQNKNIEQKAPLSKWDEVRKRVEEEKRNEGG